VWPDLESAVISSRAIVRSPDGCGWSGAFIGA
jgi:hypothetical protein